MQPLATFGVGTVLTGEMEAKLLEAIVGALHELGEQTLLGGGGGEKPSCDGIHRLLIRFALCCHAVRQRHVEPIVIQSREC